VRNRSGAGKLVVWMGIVGLAGARAMAGDAPLADAVQAGEQGRIDALLSREAPVNAVQADGSTALHWAAYRNDTNLVKTLLARGAKADVRNRFGATPIGEAAKIANAEAVRLLLAAGANVESANEDGETALMLAARTGSVPVAKQLLARGADVNASEKWRGQTALMWAAGNDHPDMVELLLAHKAKPDIRAAFNDWGAQITSEPRAQYRPTGGLTALMYAGRSGCVRCIEVLLKRGADVNLPNPDGVTALMIAIDNLHYDAARYLLEHGANPHVWDWYGRTALYVAVDMHSYPNSRAAFNGPLVQVDIRDKTSATELIKLLLDAGVDPNPQLRMHRPGRGGNSARFVENLLHTGATPLLRAAVAQDPQAIELLLAHGALVDLPNIAGITPLMAAAGIGIATVDPRPLFEGDMQGRAIATMKALLKGGADVNAKIVVTSDHNARNARAVAVTNRDGQTALYGPVGWGWPRVTQFLLEHGAHVDVKDANGSGVLESLPKDRAGRNTDADAEVARLILAASTGGAAR
jgi:uncharacterized protein